MAAESEFEKKCREYVESKQGFMWKETPPPIGRPDRVVILPFVPAAWCELKAPGKKPSKLQDLWLRRLNRRGHQAAWFDDLDDFVEWIDTLMED